MSDRIHIAPPNTGVAYLGHTLTELLYAAVDTYGGKSKLSHKSGSEWVTWTLNEFRRESEELAVGLRELGLQPGSKVAFYMHSDVHFCIADMACLIAGLINVPIYLTHSLESIEYVINHAEAHTLIVSDESQFNNVQPILERTGITKVIVARGSVPRVSTDDLACYGLPAVQGLGRDNMGGDSDYVDRLLRDIKVDDVATIIYTSGTTGVPKGVVLTHENLSSNGMTSFSGMDGYRSGPGGEVGLSFLPLTHVFARALHYGFLGYGTDVFFSTPDRVAEDFIDVRPTVFATVPRVLEKVYSRILERGESLSATKRKLLYWAIELARKFDVGSKPSGVYKLKMSVADKLVFSKWREVMGGRVRYVISGGAALSKELADIFSAAGINIIQGYGLTETSPVITFTRPSRNKTGTVGEPIPGVEVKIAEDGEILTRGPHVMKGYYKAPEKTAEVIDDDGWFHTGDIGEFDGTFLRITDRKKDLFKLSTGKYVMPQPLENRLKVNPHIEQAVVVGPGYKYCSALIFPEESILRAYADSVGIDGKKAMAELVVEPAIIRRYQELIDKANEGMAPWSTIKHFALIPEVLSMDDGLLTPTLKVKRTKVYERYATEISKLYASH